MRGAGASITKAHYQGENEDFIVHIDDYETFRKWKGTAKSPGDKSIPMTEFVASYKVFVTHKHGAQGVQDGASNSLLDNEFGTHNEDDVVRKILEAAEHPNGPLNVATTSGSERGGDRNDSKGQRVAH